MKTIAINPYERLVKYTNDQLLTTSRTVAEKFEKRHDHVVASIKELVNRLKSASPDFQGDQMFIESNYTDEQGRTYPEYLMNRDGFSLLVMGFNNTEKVLQWKLAFINAFNQMEESISHQEQLLTKDSITQALTISGDRANAAAKYLGIELGMARIHAMNEVEDELGVNLDSWKRFLPPSEEYDIPALNPTNIATILKEDTKQPFSAQKVNLMLEKLGYQSKNTGEWLLTTDGKQYAHIIPFDNKLTGHAGYQIKWKVTVLDKLKECLKNT